jgi:hypothetical protein
MVIGGVSAADAEERCGLLAAHLGDAYKQHAQSDEEHAETDWATPVECEPHVHFFLLLFENDGLNLRSYFTPFHLTGHLPNGRDVGLEKVEREINKKATIALTVAFQI